MINITLDEYKKYRPACPHCNNSIYSNRGAGKTHEFFCKKCRYNSEFYTIQKGFIYLLQEEIVIASKKDRIYLNINYPSQTAFITLYRGSPKDIMKREYTMPLKDEYFDENCFIRIDALDTIVERFRKVSIMS